MYTPILQETDSGTVNMNMMSANLSYPIKIKKVRLTNMGSYIFQNGTKGASAEAFTTHFVSFNQNVQFPKGPNPGFDVELYLHPKQHRTLALVGGSLSAGGTLFKKWNNGGGVNIYANAKEQRYMLFYRTEHFRSLNTLRSMYRWRPNSTAAAGSMPCTRNTM